MKKLHMPALLLAASLGSAPVVAQDPVEIQMQMFNVLYEIEEAMGLPHRASTAINALDEEGQQILYDAISNKEGFSDAANAAVHLIQGAQAAAPAVSAGAPSVAAASAAYTPDYPPTSNASYAFANLFGLTSSPADRCDMDDLEIYRAVLVGAEEALVLGDAACTVAGCDPTGIVCASVCGAVEAVGYAVHLAKVPIDTCEAHEANVNAAEIEAGFENTVSILSDIDSLEFALNLHDGRLVAHDNHLSAHDGNLTSHDNNLAAHDSNLTTHDGNLTTHDGNLATHDAEIKALLADVRANQHEIIKLIKTPQGKRPGWNQDGY